MCMNTRRQYMHPGWENNELRVISIVQFNSLWLLHGRSMHTEMAIWDKIKESGYNIVILYPHSQGYFSVDERLCLKRILI